MTSHTFYEPRARDVNLPTRGGQMAVLDFGPAERPVDIVFSHANGFNARTYRSILAPLADALRILAVDLRGHGDTRLAAEPTGRTDWSDFRNDLLALLPLETSHPVVLAGHSMGGTSSLLAAATGAAQIRSLVLFDPVFFDAARAAQVGATNPLAEGADRRRATFPDKAAVVRTYTGRGGFRTWAPEQVADYVEAGFRETDDGQVTLTCAPSWEASNFRTHGSDAWSALRNTRCPIRILRAEQGSTARIDDRLEELRAMPHITVETVPGTTHFLPMERPDRVRQALRDAVGV